MPPLDRIRKSGSCRYLRQILWGRRRIFVHHLIHPISSSSASCYFLNTCSMLAVFYLNPSRHTNRNLDDIQNRLWFSQASLSHHAQTDLSIGHFLLVQTVVSTIHPWSASLGAYTFHLILISLSILVFPISSLLSIRSQMELLTLFFSS